MKLTWLGCGVLFIICFNVQATAKVIEVIAIEYPPFTSSNSANGGVAFDLLPDVLEGKKVIWRPFFQPPKRALQSISEGKWCASFYPPRTVAFKRYQLSERIVHLGLIRKVAPDAFKWHSLSELKGRSIALLRTSAQSQFAQQFIRAGLNISFVENVKIGVQMVKLGRVDFAFADNNLLQRLSEQGMAVTNLEFSDSVLFSTPVSVYVNPKCEIRLPADTLISEQY